MYRIIFLLGGFHAFLVLFFNLLNVLGTLGFSMFFWVDRCIWKLFDVCLSFLILPENFSLSIFYVSHEDNDPQKAKRWYSGISLKQTPLGLLISVSFMEMSAL